MYKQILTALENGIFTITINRPEKLNALNSEVMTELADALDEIYQNPLILSAIITGSGQKAFVAGADISEFDNIGSAEGAMLSQKGQETVFNKIENCPKPIIAAVNGLALGGGCELAMACHLRVASQFAKFGQPEVNLGLIPGYGGTQRLTQLVGKGRAMELLLTGKTISASEALQWGLVNHETTPEALLTASIAFLQLINAKAPLAISQIIALVNTAAQGNATGLSQEIAAFGQLFDTKDAKEGISAFLEKRKPRFIGN